MKLIEFKDFSKDNFVRAINKRKIAIIICVAVISILPVTFGMLILP